MWYDEDDNKSYNNDRKNKLNSLSYYETEMHLTDYLIIMDKRIEKYHPIKDKNKIYYICMEVGKNFFDRSYYTIKDSTRYLNLWKYWINSHGIDLNEDLEYIWDHIFI